ncbi:phosphatase and actin regulator 4 isoform X7 [Aphidius gifuensis]|uniref:phosphatase and actin regulator 4 isoform X7 n=1 Tax=Aphidius gifuensis TaxID=684658 RepID=UPI001CDD7FB0|nr:phosphatase and actin regulator 4 isoform X7 [Aphidius gifuensis]
MWEEGKSSRTPVVVSFQEVASLLNRGKDDNNATVLAGTSDDNRKSQRPLWRFYSARMLTHSHSDGEFPLYTQAKKQNGAALRTNSLGSGTRTPPIEKKSKFSTFGRLFKPWKWKRKKKSEKFEAASRSLERKISVRANREELVQKGILLPDSQISTIPENGPLGDSDVTQKPPTPQQQQQHHHHQQQSTAIPGITTTLGQCQQSSIGSQNSTSSNNSHSGCIGPTSNQSSPHPSPLYPGIPSSNQLNGNTQVEKGVLQPTAEEQQAIDRYMSPMPPHNTLMLSELPEPPIPLSEIGPIPPPPMFSSPSPTMDSRHQQDLPITSQHNDEDDEDEIDAEDDDDSLYVFRVSQPDPAIDTSRVEEIPAKEPKFHAVPLKSALKKKNTGSGPGTPQNTPTQENRPLTLRQELHASFKRPPLRPRIRICSRPVRFGLALPCTLENKENARPYVIREDSDGSDDGQVLYRDDYDDEESRMADKLARKESLSLKLALRPDRQELINRNILQIQSDNERQESKEAIGARLIRRLSMRPTQEELEERNILKKQSPAEEKKQKEEKKRYLLRKLSFRPTVEELKEKKIIRFNDYIEVTQAHDYDRRADKPWTRLTPKDKAAIRKELNEFKSSEMAVHEESRHLTRYHRP